MSKPTILVTGPVDNKWIWKLLTRYMETLIELDKYDVKINSVRLGFNTTKRALEDGNEHHEKIKAHILDNHHYQHNLIYIYTL